MSDESRSDGGMKDADITSALGVGQSTVERIRKRCVEEGVESALLLTQIFSNSAKVSKESRKTNTAP